MIEYVNPGNIDDRVLGRAAGILAAGDLIAFPTDTSWSIACTIHSREGIRRLKRLSGTRDERHFTLMCATIAQISELCSLDNTRFRLVKRLSPGPYVFILKPHLGTEKALDIKRKEIGARIPDHPVPLALIVAAGTPLFTITAKRSMGEAMEREIDDGDEDPERDSFHIPEEELFDGGWELEDIQGLSLILDSGEERPRLVSTVLDLTGDEARVLRQGAGPAP